MADGFDKDSQLAERRAAEAEDGPDPLDPPFPYRMEPFDIGYAALTPNPMASPDSQE